MSGMQRAQDRLQKVQGDASKVGNLLSLNPLQAAKPDSPAGQIWTAGKQIAQMMAGGGGAAAGADALPATAAKAMPLPGAPNLGDRPLYNDTPNVMQRRLGRVTYGY